MKKIDINALIQLLGMVGIIVSLIFVGLEMRQSQNIALAAQQQSRTEIFTNLVQSLNESSEVSLYQIFMKNEQNKTLTSSEKKIAEKYSDIDCGIDMALNSQNVRVRVESACPESYRHQL